MPSIEQGTAKCRKEERLPRYELERRWRELMQRFQAIADKTGDDIIRTSPSLLEEAEFLASEFERLDEEES